VGCCVAAAATARTVQHVTRTDSMLASLPELWSMEILCQECDSCKKNYRQNIILTDPMRLFIYFVTVIQGSKAIVYV